MAVAYKGGVVVGADSRVSTGVYISNRASDKITAVDDKIYCCRSGSAADTQAVSDYVRYFLDQHRMEYGKPPKVATAASFFQNIVRARSAGPAPTTPLRTTSPPFPAFGAGIALCLLGVCGLHIPLVCQDMCQDTPPPRRASAWIPRATLNARRRARSLVHRPSRLRLGPHA